MVFAWRWSRSRHLAGYQGCRRGAGDHGGPSAGQGKYYGPRVHRSRSTLATPLAHGQPRAQAIRAGANQPSNWGVLDQFHTPGLASTAELAKLPRPQMRDNQGSNTMRDATFSRRDMLWAGGALTVAAAFAGPLKAAAAELSGVGPEPTSWVDSAMPEVTHRMIETNGLRLQGAEQGERPLSSSATAFPSAGIPGGISSGRWRRLGSVRWPPTCVAMGEATVRRRRRSIRFSMTSATSWVSSTLWVPSRR